MFKFQITKKTKEKARLGLLKTRHGIIETPAFIPVATQAVVKTLTSEEALEAGCQALICNTFHLHLKPGEKIVRDGGGLHDFMNWSKPLMTDSAGYQVFSLGFGNDQKVGKIAKKAVLNRVKLGNQPEKVKITEKGVYFQSPIDGKQLFIGPKESIKIQEALGADIIFAFDECTSPFAYRKYTEKSLERTHSWSEECLKFKSSNNQALYGIIQGGKYKDLRRKSAKFLSELPFDGFGIGGEFGDNKKTMVTMLRTVIEYLPENKPRHLLGIGHPEDIEKIIKEGVDTFDCIAPTHYARHGSAFTSRGKLDLNKTKFLKDQSPLDPKCACNICQSYTRSYICHLLKAKEITPLKMLTFHNLFYFNELIRGIREKIKKGKI